MTDFQHILRLQLTRREALAGLAALGAGAFLHFPGCGSSSKVWSQLKFSPVRAGKRDTITLPRGFRWHVVAAWGDPLWADAGPFSEANSADPLRQERAIGDSIDGMELFEHEGRLLLAVNNEYADLKSLLSRKAQLQTGDIAWSMVAQGVSIFEIEGRDGGYRVVLDSPYNRRVTPHTSMEITGPGRGHILMRTVASTAATRAQGTWANCGCGRTPWGTFLSCEENFDLAFSSPEIGFVPDQLMSRYGLSNQRESYAWEQLDGRFNLSKNPSEANHAGYVVEIDPRSPGKPPRKLTALGRFKHENAALTLSKDKRVVVYMGDDERGEYIYRYVSDSSYSHGANTAQLLEKGRLYVARFSEDGTGRWLELTPRAANMATPGEVCVLTRMAAANAGGTTMDRPEWLAAHPSRIEVYCALTNNDQRGHATNLGGQPMPVNGPNPREHNVYGQIVRWRPDDQDHAAASFRWDLFALAGNPKVHDDLRGGSSNITSGNMFNCPDGLHFDSRGGLWIQTDGNVSNQGDFAGHGNNQMLLADPLNGEIRRFMVGPRGCEITGMTWTPDLKTMFIGIQHPTGRFPDRKSALPRSAIVAIQHRDGIAWG